MSAAVAGPTTIRPIATYTTLRDMTEPIELVFDDPRLGLQRIIGQIEPPQLHRGDLHEIKFGLREAAQ